MKFHKQSIPHIPIAGKIGDCFRTALACLLDLEPSEVPHFVSMYYDPSGKVDNISMNKHVKDWLSAQGYMLLDMPYELDIPPLDLIYNIGAMTGPDILYLVTGMSNVGAHVVIACGSQLLWNPSHNDLIGPINGMYWVSYLLPVSMRFSQ